MSTENEFRLRTTMKWWQLMIILAVIIVLTHLEPESAIQLLRSIIESVLSKISL